MHLPHTTPGVIPLSPASRLASRITPIAAVADDHPLGNCSVAILGLPDDTGITLNNGRPGAAAGPAAFRAALANYGVAEPAHASIALTYPAVYDAGDVSPASTDLAATHARVTAAAEALHRRGIGVVVGIGGGHDLTFPLVRAAVNTRNVNRGLYVDPHLDVRPEPGSGMAFRALIEHCGIARLTNIGCQPLVTLRAHRAWFQLHGGTVALDASDLDTATPLTKALIDQLVTDALLPATNPPADSSDTTTAFVSLDLDAIDAAQAPGVSALNPCGLSVASLGHFANAAGRNRHVVSFDIMELSPPHDHQNRTARVAAYLFLQFLGGLAVRAAAR